MTFTVPGSIMTLHHRFTGLSGRLLIVLIALTAVSAVSARDGDADRYLATGFPEGWTNTPATKYTNASPDDTGWWKSFNDPILDTLVSIGVANNYNLRSAYRRITMSRAQLGQIKAGYYPQVDLAAGWTKSRTSGATVSSNTPATNTSVWSLGASMNWEIDVFGKITSRVKQGKINVDLSKVDYAAAMVALQAEIASQYFQLRVWQEQMIVARQHAVSQKHVVDVTVARYEAKLASMLDVSQAQTVYYSTIASIPMLESSITGGINSLAVLVGAYPGDLQELLGTPRPLPEYCQQVAVGVPLDLLSRRPDIVAARMQIESDAAALGLARKQYLPSLALQGSIGTAAHKGKDLFKNNSFTYTIAPTLSWTVFDGFGRKFATQQAAEAMKADIEQYNLTVSTAVQEVDNAILSYYYRKQEIEKLKEVISSCQKSEQLSFELFRGGLSPIINVVDAQLNLLSYQNNEIVSRGQALVSLVNLYKALGGSWNLEMIEKTK